MSCNQCIPTLTMKSVSISGTTATITVNGLLPARGQFNIKSCRSCVPVCNNATTVIITDGVTTYATVLTRCGNDLTLPVLICHLRRFGVAHFCGSTKTAGTAIIQDKLCPITTFTTATATAPAASVETAQSEEVAKASKAKA